MKVAKINIQDCIRAAVYKELMDQDFNIMSNDLIVCGNHKLQRTGEGDECTWSSLDNSNEELVKYDDSLSAIVDRFVEGEELLLFESLLEFCHWYVEQNKEKHND